MCIPWPLGVFLLFCPYFCLIMRFVKHAFSLCPLFEQKRHTALICLQLLGLSSTLHRKHCCAGTVLCVNSLFGVYVIVFILLSCCWLLCCFHWYTCTTVFRAFPRVRSLFDERFFYRCVHYVRSHTNLSRIISPR